MILFKNYKKEDFRERIIEIQEITGLQDQKKQKMEDDIKIPYY